jgi:hypothetical protein
VGVSLGSKVPFCFAPHLLGFDLWGDDGVVYDVRAVDCVDGRHPIGFCQLIHVSDFFILCNFTA